MSSTTIRWRAAILILGIALAGAGLYADQDTSGRTPGTDRQPGPGGRRGPGGPGGPGQGGRGAMGRGGMFGPMALDQLNVTPAQREQIHAVLQSQQAAREDLRARSVSAGDALRAAVNATPFDEGTIRAKSAEVAAAQADAAVLEARVRTEVFQLLTPEQRAQAATLPPHPRGRRGGPPAL